MLTNQYPSVLLRCAARDLHRRFSILHGEIGHLLRSITQRQTNGKNTGHDAHAQTDESAFLGRLENAANQLQTDIEISLKSSKEILNPTDTSDPKSLLQCRKHRMLTDGQLFTIEQAALRLKANVLSERIGNLHDRLDQLLERSNPDHPGVTRRRRSEQGIQDKYISEFSRWLYRDLARLASDPKYLGERYPYDVVPAVFQFWDYARASKHHSYITSEGYDQWKGWRDSNGCEKEGDSSAGLHLDASNKFAALRLPYWIPECPELHPIIAHELAHQVLRDIYGYELHLGDLERGGAGVNRMLRRLYKCVEEWTAEVDHYRGGAYRPLPVEILCDAMAASRCGVAYLYALFIEFLDNDVLADLAKDHTGMLEAIDGKSNDSSHRQNRSRGLFIQAETLIDRQVTWLLRITSVLGFVRKVFNPTGAELEFCNELEVHLKEIQALYASGDAVASEQDPALTSYYNHFTSFSKDIIHSLTTAGWVGVETPLMKSARRMWNTNDGHVHDFFLGKQMLGKAWSEVFSGVFPRKNSSFNNENMLTAVDLPWIGIWGWVRSNPINTYARLPNEMLNAIDAAREDYVFRTSNPRALFELLGYECKDLSDQQRLKSSSLDALRHKAAHLEWLDALKSLEAHQVSSDPFVHRGRMHSIAGVAVPSADSLVMAEKPSFHKAFSSASDVRRWFNEKSRFRLDLLSISTPDKRSCYMGNDVGGVGIVSSNFTGLKVASQVLLGRYDAFALIPRRECDSPDIQAYAVRGGAKYSTRSRNLIHTDGLPGNETDVSLVTDRAQSAVALVLIGLHWPGLRLPFLHWVKELNNRFEGLFLDICLSDGWEDFTFFINIKNVGSFVPDVVLREFAELVEALNAHPFVTVTETLFTSRLMDLKATESVVDVTFNCRISPLGRGFPSATNLKAQVESRLAVMGESTLKINVSSVYGLTDYRVMVANWRHLSEIGEVLECLYDIDSILRLDTRVSIKPEEIN